MTDERTACVLILTFAIFWALFGLHYFFLARLERRRVRIELDYVRRSKISHKQLKKYADDAYAKLHCRAEQIDRDQAERHEKFWTAFAASYGKATGQVFPKPPPEILPTKPPSRGSA